MITIQELLYNRGLGRNEKIKFVRHNATLKFDDKSNKINLYDKFLYEFEDFLTFQSEQMDNRFEDVNYIVSFIAEKGMNVRFIGVYKILDYQTFENTQYGVFNTKYTWFYTMEKVSGFEDLENRVIIRWNAPLASFLKNIHNTKSGEIVEIQKGLHDKVFKDYFEFILSFKELKEIVEEEYADWKKMLSATNGIYLIGDRKTGKLYVGSAYGEEGIWGRWKIYVKTNGHGNNKSLKELVETDKDYGYNFQFTILMLLSKTATADEVIEKETLFKKKLGTHAFGLNNN